MVVFTVFDHLPLHCPPPPGYTWPGTLQHSGTQQCVCVCVCACVCVHVCVCVCTCVSACVCVCMCAMCMLFLPFRIARTVVEIEGCGIVELKLAGNALQVSLQYVHWAHVYVRTYASPTHCPSPSPVSQHTTIVSTVSLLKGSPREVQFDLASRADYLDPDKLERTIYVKPLAVNCTKEMLKVCVCVCVCVCACVCVGACVGACILVWVGV